MTAAEIEVDGFTLSVTLKDGRLTSLPCALGLEYCNGRTDVWYFEKRARLVSSYAKQLAFLVTDENLQNEELYQPYHLKRLVCITLNKQGKSTVIAQHPEVDQSYEGCLPQHQRDVASSDIRRLYDKEKISA